MIMCFLGYFFYNKQAIDITSNQTVTAKTITKHDGGVFTPATYTIRTPDNNIYEVTEHGYTTKKTHSKASRNKVIIRKWHYATINLSSSPSYLAVKYVYTAK